MRLAMEALTGLLLLTANCVYVWVNPLQQHRYHNITSLTGNMELVADELELVGLHPH